MRTAVLLALCVLAPRDADAQPSAPVDSVWLAVDTPPWPVGGIETLQRRVRPLRRDGVGLVFIEAVVEADGSVRWAEVVESRNEWASAAALDAVLQTPFTPGRQSGEPVSTRVVLPVWVPSCQPPDPYGYWGVGESLPQLVGGLRALQALTAYPEEARREGVEGQVVVQFVVDRAGGVQDLTVLRSLFVVDRAAGVQGPTVLRSPDERLTQAALAAVRRSLFTPGLRGCHPVDVRFAVPVTFRLSRAR